MINLFPRPVHARSDSLQNQSLISCQISWNFLFFQLLQTSLLCLWFSPFFRQISTIWSIAKLVLAMSSIYKVQLEGFLFLFLRGGLAGTTLTYPPAVTIRAWRYFLFFSRGLIFPFVMNISSYERNKQAFLEVGFNFVFFLAWLVWSYQSSSRTTSFNFKLFFSFFWISFNFNASGGSRISLKSRSGSDNGLERRKKKFYGIKLNY